MKYFSEYDGNLALADKKSERFQVRFSPEVLRRLRVLSASQGLSMSQFLTCVINECWDEQYILSGFDAK